MSGVGVFALICNPVMQAAPTQAYSPEAAVHSRLNLADSKPRPTPKPRPKPRPKPKPTTRPTPVVKSYSHGLDVGAVTRTQTVVVRRRNQRSDSDAEDTGNGRRKQTTTVAKPRTYTQPALRVCRAPFVPAGETCGELPPRPVPARPAVEQVTTEVVNRTLTDRRVISFPGSPVHIQPRGVTLVNLETNIYAEQRSVSRIVDILTWPVEVRAVPASYTWTFGDGEQLTTTSLGAPYPDGDVVHRYVRRGKVVVSVTLNYDTWFRTPANDWTAAGLVSVPGPGAPLLVCEARPVLTDPGNPDEPPAGGDPGNPCDG